MPLDRGLSRLRVIELLGAISLATDLGTGLPHAHAIRTSILAAAIARELGLDGDAMADAQRVALLRFLGCTADSSETARMTGGDDLAFVSSMAPYSMGDKPEAARQLLITVGADQSPLRRAGLVVAALTDPGGAKRSLSAHCEVAAMLAERLGASAVVREALAHAHERWDGAGFPEGLRGEAVPISVRIAVVAGDADLWWRHGRSDLTEVLQARSGRAYDPRLAKVCLQLAPRLLADLDQTDAWETLLASDPSGETLKDADVDRALRAVADFTDLKSPWTRGHSPRVADVALTAATALGLPPDDAAQVRRAGLVHDLGRVGVPNGIWDRAGPLGVGGWERVRMHSYLTESTLACCPGLADLGRIAGSHHERMDGSGYHRGRRDLSLAERVLGAADAIVAMREDRPYRVALNQEEIANSIQAEIRAGRIERIVAEAVLVSAGHRLTRAGHRERWPAGLSDREVDVLRLLARGRTNKEVASRLNLSAKTVGRHIENIYDKIAVNSRAAATVFAMEHRLLDG